MYKIYLISSVNTQNHLEWKVGVSKHPEKRKKEIFTSNPGILTIVALYSIDNKAVAYKTETLIHNYLKEYKVNGEWFESYALNAELFFTYCEKYVKIAKTVVKIKENLHEFKDKY